MIAPEVGHRRLRDRVSGRGRRGVHWRTARAGRERIGHHPQQRCTARIWAKISPEWALVTALTAAAPRHTGPER